MLFAVLNHTFVKAENVDDRNADYFCPDCLESVFLKKGIKLAHHFAHTPLSACPHAVGSAGESELHLQAKSAFLVSLRSNDYEVTIEKNLIDRRADVYATKNGVKFAIEVQKSNLTERDWRKRTDSYHSKEIHALWVRVTSEKYEVGKLFNGEQLLFERALHETDYGLLHYSPIERPNAMYSVSYESGYLSNSGGISNQRDEWNEKASLFVRDARVVRNIILLKDLNLFSILNLDRFGKKLNEVGAAHKREKLAGFCDECHNKMILDQEHFCFFGLCGRCDEHLDNSYSSLCSYCDHMCHKDD